MSGVMNSDAAYEASDTYVGKIIGNDVADVWVEAEDDAGLADEVVAGCVVVVKVGKDADDVGGVDECVQDDDDNRLVGNSVVGTLAEYDTGNCEVAKTEDGCSTEVVECVVADDCAEYDCVSGSVDVKVGEADNCADVGDVTSAGDVDGRVSAVYAEVEDGSSSGSADDVADASTDCEDVIDDDNSEEVGDGVSSDGSGSAKVEDADTIGVEEVKSCSLPYFEDVIAVLTEDGKGDGDGDGIGDGDGVGIDVVAEGRAVAVLVL
ncbi:hypothetical protein GGH93_001683 [Coemansia aciculifera]|nr:hypothetical protein GGH93_001683 [Coemansia aciculifera]